MSTIFIRNGLPFNVQAPQTIGDVQYPAGWFAALSDEELATFGIAKVEQQERPDDRFYFVTDNGDGTFSSQERDIADLKAAALAQVKEIRRQTLDRFVRSAGVQAVYDQNLTAAKAFKASDIAFRTRDGRTAEDYLVTVGAATGMSAAQFADFIIAENTLGAQRCVEVESEYIRVGYEVIANATFESIQTVVSDYTAFCAARQEV
jgi:hypothetical protein